MRLGGGVGLEAVGELGLEARLVALRIQRRLAALRRRQDDIRARILELVIGSSELFEPEASLLTGVAELVMRGENHEDLHARLPWAWHCAVAAPREQGSGTGRHGAIPPLECGISRNRRRATFI